MKFFRKLLRKLKSWFSRKGEDMSFGLQVLDSQGRVTLDTRDRVAKIIAVIDVPLTKQYREVLTYSVPKANPQDTFSFVTAMDAWAHGTSVGTGIIRYEGFLDISGTSRRYITGGVKIVVVKY